MIRKVVTQLLIFLLIWAATAQCRAEGRIGIAQTRSELGEADKWFSSHLNTIDSRPDVPPFSFRCGGASSANFLQSWHHSRVVRPLDRDRREVTNTWTDAATGLEVREVGVRYLDYPVVEWTVYIKNTGSLNSPLIEELRGLDTVLATVRAGDFVLHGIKGDYCVPDSYEPYDLDLKAGHEEQFSPAQSGKSCDGPRGWPYFNLQTPDGGAIIAVGWPGQWSAAFTTIDNQHVRLLAGQEITHFRLEPGEEVRTPLTALLFWRGADIARAQNLWRRWYMAHILPRTLGKPQGPIAQIQAEGSMENTHYIQTFLDAGIHADICWRDAGNADTWYPSANGPYKGADAWLNTGTWEVDKTRYPQGFKPYSNWVHEHGMQFLLWFEPERIGDPNSWLGHNHPEWMLPGSSNGAQLNLGDPAALAWLTDHIDAMIKVQGLDWYREDMNGVGPLPAWKRHDVEDRQGLTENHYVQGHLAFWDALRSHNPGLHIDSCASGGRRNDIETMRRAVPLVRSDFQFPNMPDVVISNQCQTYGLSQWLPYQGTGCYTYDAYSLRSFYLASFGMGYLSKDNMEAQRRAYAECARIAPMFLGDYYPLTPYSRTQDKWIAWQFDRPEKGDGALQAFRREQCGDDSIVVKLQGLDAKATYEITNFDVPGTTRTTGSDLMKGFFIHIDAKPGSAILTYKRL